MTTPTPTSNPAEGLAGLLPAGLPSEATLEATLARLAPSMDLADDSLRETSGQQVSVGVNPAHAGRFFAASRIRSCKSRTLEAFPHPTLSSINAPIEK